MNEFMLDEQTRMVQQKARMVVRDEVDPEYLRRMDRDEIRYVWVDALYEKVRVWTNEWNRWRW